VVALLGSEEGCQSVKRTASVVSTGEVFSRNLQSCHSALLSFVFSIENDILDE
jgi:hypothetical protein